MGKGKNNQQPGHRWVQQGEQFVPLPGWENSLSQFQIKPATLWDSDSGQHASWKVFFLKAAMKIFFLSHPGWGNAIHTKFCKTWWLNICLNLYLPLGHIFFSYKAHFMCAWDLKSAVGDCSYFNHFSTFSSLTLGVLQKLGWVTLSMFYIALLDLHPLPLRDWLSGSKSQCKWFLHNNFQSYYSFYGQRSTLNKPQQLGKIKLFFFFFKSIL